MAASDLPYLPDQDFLLPHSPMHPGHGGQASNDEGRSAYRKRQWIAEPPNGWINDAGIAAVRY